MKNSESPGLKVKSPSLDKPFCGSLGDSFVRVKMNTKVCPVCGEEKPLSEYHKRSDRKSGVQSKCKSCCKKRDALFNAEHRDEIRIRNQNFRNKHPRYGTEYYIAHKEERNTKSKAYYQLNKEKIKEKDGRRFKNFPEKTKAKAAVGNAIRAGALTRPDHCSKCGKECKPDAHHWSYLEEHWLDVEWLCRSCHIKVSYLAKGKS